MSKRVSKAALINTEMRRLQKASAILICVVASEFAEEKIDLGDAVLVALKLVGESVSGLDQLSAKECPVADARDNGFHVALGKRLETLRTRLQFTPHELGDRVGVSAQSIRSPETGVRRVPVALMPTFARVLGVRVEVLFGVTAAPRLRASHVSPAQRRHVEQLRGLARRDRLAVMRITHALARCGRGA